MERQDKEGKRSTGKERRKAVAGKIKKNDRRKKTEGGDGTLTEK